MKVEVKLVHSGIGHNERQRATLRGLGLRKMNQTRVLDDTPQIRGMITKVAHLVTFASVKE